MADLEQNDWRNQLAEDPNAVILDVRTQDEIDEGYIPEAINLDIYRPQEFMDGIKQLDPEKNYYVYCRSGNRSGQACALLNSIGITNAYNLKGGFQEWDGPVTS